MTLKISKRAEIAPFYAMEVLRAANARAAAGGDVLHLEIGEPGHGAPQKVIEAAQAALARGELGYTESLGLPAMRARIARHYRDFYGVEIDPARVVVTTGASGGFILAFLAAFDAGDRVALAEPGYPAYRNILQALGVEVVALATEASDGFQPTPAVLERNGRVDGLIVASPSNPTGTMLGRDQLAALAGWCRQRGVRLISDEIYHGITYDRPACTALAVDDRAIVANSLSKYFAMTGWRLGWLVVPPDLIDAVARLAQSLYISPPTLPQHAGLVVFDCRAALDEYVRSYARNRAVLLERLPEAGFGALAPADGAFYIYAEIAELAQDSQSLCRRLLEETGVAAVPGIDFDRQRGHRYVRFSFAGREADIAEAATRLVAWRGRNRR